MNEKEDLNSDKVFYKAEMQHFRANCIATKIEA